MKNLVFSMLAFVVLCAFTAANDQPTQWTLLNQQNGVQVNYKFSDCDLEQGFKQQWVLFQLKNSTSEIKVVEYDLQVSFNGKCTTCDGSEEHHRKLRLQPGETLEGKCSLSSDPELRVVSKLLDIPNPSKSELTNILIANLKVYKAN
jgi:hypothetical protein